MNKNFELNERITKFVINIIRNCRKIEINFESRIFISQLLRSASSIGANYCESYEATTHNDRYAKLGIARKEAKETEYWLNIVSEIYPIEELSNDKKEIIEILKILSTIQWKLSIKKKSQQFV